MRIVICLPCRAAIRVLEWSEDAEHLIGSKSSFWPLGYQCPHCERSLRMVNERDVDPASFKNLKIRDLTPTEAFMAFMGAGLPGERSFTQEEIESLLKETPIRKVDGVMVNNCFVLNHLVLWDGTKLFFGASPEGSVIYRVASPHKYAENL